MPKINQEEYEVLKGLDDKWKWIARDDENQTYSAEIYVFEERPKRADAYWNNVSAHGYALLEEWDDLFQFIQWEDEPYKIAELIEEYEKDYKGSWEHAIKFSKEMRSESEETEVKKQKLIEKWESAIEAAEFYGKGKEDRLIEYMRNFVDDLNRLDEPEVLSQEWIDEHKESWQDLSVTGYSVPEKDLQNLLVPKQIKPKELYKAITGISPSIEEVCDSSRTETFLDESVSVERIVEAVMEAVGPSEPEKPAIPKFVADWIEEMKQDERPLYSVMSSLMNKTNHEWAVWKSANKNFSEVVAQAWLDGYTVEEEQRLTARAVIEKHIELLKKQEEVVDLKPYYDLLERIKNE